MTRRGTLRLVAGRRGREGRAQSQELPPLGALQGAEPPLPRFSDTGHPQSICLGGLQIRTLTPEPSRATKEWSEGKWEQSWERSTEPEGTAGHLTETILQGVRNTGVGVEKSQSRKNKLLSHRGGNRRKGEFLG